MTINFCIPCLLGMEGFIADELRALEAENVCAENGRVLFSGDENILEGKILNQLIHQIDTENIRLTLKSVFNSLEERGYNPTNQIVGYLISGDPGYISSHKEARNKMTRLDRSKVIEVLLKEFKSHQ